MLRLLLSLTVEILLGLSLGGLLLAGVVPLLLKTGVMTAGDALGSLLVPAILALGAGAMVFRPGSALSRRFK